MNKKQILESIITDDSCAMEFASEYMVDERPFDFRLMLRELQKDKPDHALIGRLFERSYNYTIGSYVSMKS